jgi:hypothetical protein
VKRPLWVLIALLVVHFVIILRHHARPLITDELYYFDRAHYFAQDRGLKPIDERVTTGPSDWRPPGYPILLGTFGYGTFDDPAAFRLRVTIVQFLAVAALLIATFVFFTRSTNDTRAHWIAAILFGLAPWPFEFTNDIGPDELAAALIGCSLLLLWRARGSSSWLHAVMGFSLSLTLRPEMIVMPPFIAAAAFTINRRWSVRNVVAAALGFGVIVGAQVLYRTTHSGRVSIFGEFRIANAGAFHWTRTWFGTEKEAYDFVYAITEGRSHELPARAFDSDQERGLVEVLTRYAQANGYSPGIDATFENLANQRTRRHPLRTMLVRAANVFHVWINLETPSPILEELTPVPRPIRRVLLGGLLLLRIVIIVAGFIGAWRARHSADPYDKLTLLMFAYIVLRTLLVGIVLDWRVHRYMLSAWIPLLWCAARAFNRTTARPSPSSGREVFARADRGGDGGAAIAGEARPC